MTSPLFELKFYKENLISCHITDFCTEEHEPRTKAFPVLIGISKKRTAQSLPRARGRGTASAVDEVLEPYFII
jgi:hypothetical protein